MVATLWDAKKHLYQSGPKGWQLLLRAAIHINALKLHGSSTPPS